MRFNDKVRGKLTTLVKKNVPNHKSVMIIAKSYQLNVKFPFHPMHSTDLTPTINLLFPELKYDDEKRDL